MLIVLRRIIALSSLELICVRSVFLRGVKLMLIVLQIIIIAYSSVELICVRSVAFLRGVVLGKKLGDFV